MTDAIDKARNEFAERMRAKGVPASCQSDASHRIFYDPPELIQMAFGGREWFHETDCRAVHRLGLFQGLGWKLGEYVRKQLDGPTINVNTIWVRARPHNISRDEPLYDMYFLAVEMPEDVLDPLQVHHVHHRAGLTAAQLKPTYAEVLGEHAI